MRHRSLLRTYHISQGGFNAILARTIFISLILFPQFFALYLPAVLVQKACRGSRFHIYGEVMRLRVGDWIRWTAILAERWAFRPIFGNVGYAIDDDSEDSKQ